MRLESGNWKHVPCRVSGFSANRCSDFHAFSFCRSRQINENFYSAIRERRERERESKESERSSTVELEFTDISEHARCANHMYFVCGHIDEHDDNCSRRHQQDKRGIRARASFTEKKT